MREREREIDTLIDSGSDLSLLWASEYAMMGSLVLRDWGAKFKGIGESVRETLDECDIEIQIDSNRF